jgi:hypothetical protein
LGIARKIRCKYPNTRILFGGASVIDIEGEFDFTLGGEERFVEWLTGNRVIVNGLDDLPSPYLCGVFNKMVNPKSQAIIETTQGCPFSCSFCGWGDTKIRHHSIEYVEREAHWMGRNKIPYVFCADGNFGLFDKDIQIAEIYAGVKRVYGFPEKFRVCYAKGTNNNVFKVAKILNDAGMSKSVTISFQSMNEKTNKAINRQNINEEDFNKMVNFYNKEKIPIYSEIICGLPEETLDSFKEGLNRAIRGGNQLYVYVCNVIPNTTMASREYREKYGIKTIFSKVTPVHCQPLDEDEFEEIVIETSVMPVNDFKEALIYSWQKQLEYCFGCKNTDEVNEFFNDCCERLLDGQGRCVLIDNIYYEPEEAAYLKWFCTDTSNGVEKVIYARKNGTLKEK